MNQKIDNDKMWESLIRNSIGTDLYVQLKKSFKEQGLQYNPETKEIERIEQPSEHKLVEAVVNEPVEQKPKFKEGDVITNGICNFVILKYDRDCKNRSYYVLMNSSFCGSSWLCEEVDKEFKLVEPKMDICKGCNNTMGCLTCLVCIDGSHWSNIEEPEPELSHQEVTKESDQKLTEFEEEFLAIVDSWCHGDGRVYKDCNEQALKDARLLISIARKQLQPEFDAEIEQAYKNQDEVVYNRGYDKGFEDARKQFIEEACEYIRKHINDYYAEDFKKALEKGE